MHDVFVAILFINANAIKMLSLTLISHVQIPYSNQYRDNQRPQQVNDEEPVPICLFFSWELVLLELSEFFGAHLSH